MSVIAYPVTPGMGVRESINAMLAHVAYNGRDFGYLPSAVHEANYLGLLEDYAEILATDGSTLALAARVTDSVALAALAETLVSLCNDYPAYDDERVMAIEYARLIEELEQHPEREQPNYPSDDAIAAAIYELSLFVEHSEYGAWISDSDYNAALEYARTTGGN